MCCKDREDERQFTRITLEWILINNTMAAFTSKFQNQRFLRRLLITAEIIMFLAVCLTILAISNLHPVNLGLFILIAQPFFIISIVLYITVTASWFFSHHGTSQINYAPGEIIFKQGEKAEFVYSIVQGNVEITRKVVDGGEELVARFGPGDHFGEMAMISDRPRSATAKAINSVKTMTIARGDFMNLHKYMPALKENIDKVIQGRTAELENEDT